MHRGGRRAAMVAVGMLALAPASASAASSQFSTTSQGVQQPLHVRGASGSFGDQELSLPPFSVFCAAARATGEPGPGYTQLHNDIKLSRCATAVRIGEQSVTVPAKVKSVIDLFYKGDGDSSLVNPVVVVIPALKCTITIAEGAQLQNAYSGSLTGKGAGKATLPYENITVPARDLRDFPTGFQHRLQIENDQVGLLYSFAGGCANLQPASQGSYSGSMVEEAIHGNFEFVPGSEWNQIENSEEEPPEGWDIEKVAGT